MTAYSPLSQKDVKLYSSLKVKKYREQYGLFVAEGLKVVQETLGLFELKALVSTSPTSLDLLLRQYGIESHKIWLTTESDMRKLSALDKGRDIIAVYHIPKQPSKINPQGLTIALDALQNPGNMGTIIRLCDWLGIKTILCGVGTVDLYNPKVVQATAGALGSVTVHENIRLSETLPQHFDTICGTKMEGTPIHQAPKYKADDRTCILFGNEGHGISEQLLNLCTLFYSVPSAPTSTTESLNVSISAAIILSKLTGLT